MALPTRVAFQITSKECLHRKIHALKTPHRVESVGVTGIPSQFSSSNNSSGIYKKKFFLMAFLISMIIMVCATRISPVNAQAADRAEPLAVLVVDGEEVSCDPIRAADVFLNSSGMEVVSLDQLAAVFLSVGTDDHSAGGSYYSGGSNGVVEWVEAGIGARCDRFLSNNQPCNEGNMSVDAFIGEMGLDPTTGTIQYWSNYFPLSPRPSPTSPQSYYVFLGESEDHLQWYAGIHGPTGSSAFGWMHWKAMPRYHQERGHHVQLGAEIYYPVDTSIKIHRNWLNGPAIAFNFFGRTGWESWLDYAQYDINSPPPILQGYSAPDNFCAHMNTTAPCPSGSGNVARPAERSPCPATATPTATSTRTTTPTNSPTPTSTRTPTPAPTCPFSPAVCSACSNTALCGVCCLSCLSGLPGNEYCTAFNFYCNGSCP